ncbi:hypothetical protein A0H81_03070 [Grifola frondosa]|uniref:Uncharacterized protein n=1 Tax=Grifola frondosa TaxID=5627 RepID=A0A1C7MJC2_GRIFR|nr:hypothetical protein A0H81_03070 [Grifola frondosa]
MPQTSWLHALLCGAHRNLYLYAMESLRVKDENPSIHRSMSPVQSSITHGHVLYDANLLGTTSAKYWTAARQNVPGLPDCPPDMSEIRYAFLVFGKYCESCGCPSEEANHSLRIRLCSVCSGKRVLPANTLRCRCGDLDSNTSFLVVKAGLIPSAWNVHYFSYHQDTPMFHRLIPFLMLIRYNNALECDEVEYSLVLQKCRALRANARALEAYVEERKAVMIERYG